jgi:trimethylamine--corrinoid protein Co-methyltransferase
MGAAVAGGEAEFKKRPLITMIVLTVPPLNNDTDVIESVLEALKYNIQIRISPGTMAGASAPASLAGLIAQGNAEALSWLVLVQLINPGNEFVLGQNPRIMDMRYGTVSLSSPEWALMRGALGDLGRFYNLPIQAFQQVTAAKVIDAQAGYEKTMTGLMSGLGGLNVAMGNIMDSQNLCCKADYPFTNEIIGAIRRILRGFEVNEETLAVDLVDEIAHKRDYMRTKHTMKHYKENWMPTLLERRMWQEWHDDGEKDMWDRLVERAEDILANHQVEPLPQDVCDELDAITEEAESKLDKK